MPAEAYFAIVQKLSAYGFFKAGGVLVGTHALAAYGNILGVRWSAGDRTLDVDFAHVGKNVSIALPASMKLSVHDALTSLELGLLPVREFSGATGAQYRHPDDPELRIDFPTPAARRAGADGVVQRKFLGLAPEPLKFMVVLARRDDAGRRVLTLGHLRRQPSGPGPLRSAQAHRVR